MPDRTLFSKDKQVQQGEQNARQAVHRQDDQRYLHESHDEQTPAVPDLFRGPTALNIFFTLALRTPESETGPSGCAHRSLLPETDPAWAQPEAKTPPSDR